MWCMSSVGSSGFIIWFLPSGLAILPNLQMYIDTKYIRVVQF